MPESAGNILSFEHQVSQNVRQKYQSAEITDGLYLTKRYEIHFIIISPYTLYKYSLWLIICLLYTSSVFYPCCFSLVQTGNVSNFTKHTLLSYFYRVKELKEELESTRNQLKSMKEKYVIKKIFFKNQIRTYSFSFLIRIIEVSLLQCS